MGIDLKNLAAQQEIVLDGSRSAEERFEAAANCAWMLNRAALGPAMETLARAVLSKLVDDLKDAPRAESPYSDLNYWRNMELSSLSEALEREKLASFPALVCAQVLFDAARHKEAVAFFAFAVKTQPDPKAVILASYNLEVLAREGRNLALAQQAINMLTEDFAHVLSGDMFTAEVNHLLGHLLLLKGRLQETRAFGLERIGSQLLAKAAAADASYYGCYASSFAESGDYLGSIETCLDVLQQSRLGELQPRDNDLVRLELLFYLAYSLMAIGEISRAARCFELFASRTYLMGLGEARDHARLFLVKLGLRRTSLMELSEAELTNAFSELRSLSFREALSIPVEAECRQFEGIVSFLLAVSRYRRYGSASQGRRLGQTTVTLLSELAAQRPGLLDGLSVGVGPADTFRSEAERLCSVLNNRIDVLTDIRVATFGGGSEGGVAQAESTNTFILLAHSEKHIDMTPLAFNVIPVSHDASEQGAIDEALDALLIGITLIVIKRFWTRDYYVFGIVPCVESPATKFQRHRYSLLDLF